MGMYKNGIYFWNWEIFIGFFIRMDLYLFFCFVGIYLMFLGFFYFFVYLVIIMVNVGM